MRDKKGGSENKQSQKGSITLLTIILMTAMLLLSGGIVRLTKMQYNLSQLHNNTSNNYYLAEAGMEMFVDSINELIRKSSSQIAKELQVMIQEKMFIEDKISKERVLNEKYVKFDEEKGFYINKDWIILQYINKIYGVILEEYFDRKGTKPNYIYQAKSIIYSLKGERARSDQETYIKITPYINGAGMRLPSSLQDKAVIDYNYLRGVETLGEFTDKGIREEYEKILFIKDKKKYKAAIGMGVSVYTKNEKGETYSKEDLVATISFEGLEQVDYKILERYEWLGRTSELLDSGITCFKDIVVEDGGELQVEGDIRTLGTVKVKGGDLTVKDITRKDKDRQEKQEEQRKNTGSIYAMGAMQTTGSISRESHINVAGNVVAEGVQIGNPRKEKTKEQSIQVGRNIFVQDDVGIEEEVERARIQAKGVIIGISDTDLMPEGEKNPNKSSSIFNKGGTDALISMKGAYVAGQPFINYEDGTGYHRLYESIGEPYTTLQDYPEYTQMNGFTDRYILEQDEWIRKDKIKIEDRHAIYAPAYVSAEVEGERVTQQYIHPVIQNQEQALNVFYKGEENIPLSKLTNSKQEEAYDYIVLEPETYYRGDKMLEGEAGMYHKDYGEPPSERYKGIEAYMTAMKGVFLGQFESDGDGDKTPKVLKFEDLIDYKKIEKLEKQIVIDSAIKITGNQSKSHWESVDISQFDQGDKSKPVLLITKEPTKIITSQKDKNKFKGIIIALGDIQVESNIVLEGSMIINGNLVIQGETAALQVIHQPQILMQIPFENKQIERQVLDLLGLIHLEYTEIKEIFKPNRDKGGESVYYTMPQVKVKEQFDLVMKNVPLQMRINALKSERK
ncbi:MAG: hypothetical protein RR324_04195 [Cellulosilyticaceae bacterium]